MKKHQVWELKQRNSGHSEGWFESRKVSGYLVVRPWFFFQANLPANQERRILLLEHGLSRKLSILFVTGMSSAMLMVCLSKCFLYCFHSQGQSISTLAPCWASMPARFSWLVLMTRPTSSFKLSGIICTHSTPPHVQALCYMEEHPDQFAVANAAGWQDFSWFCRFFHLFCGRRGPDARYSWPCRRFRV